MLDTQRIIDEYLYILIEGTDELSIRLSLI